MSSILNSKINMKNNLYVSWLWEIRFLVSLINIQDILYIIYRYDV